MDRRAQITATPLHVPSILVVLDPAWPALFDLCLSVASSCDVLIHRCAVDAAATMAAGRRPLALIMSNTVYALDPQEFDALARDVHATLLRLDEEVTERELEAMLSGALRDTGRRADSADRGEIGGRYTMINERRSEAPGAWRSETPVPQSAASPLSMLGGLPPPTRAPSLGRSSTPTPSSASPSSLHGAPSSARTSTSTSRSSSPTPASGSPQSTAAPPPSSSARVAPTSTRSQTAPQSAPGGSFVGSPSSFPPPSSAYRMVNVSPSRGQQGAPTSARSQPSLPPPSSAPATPPSARSTMSIPPPSEHATPSAPIQRTDLPPSIRTPTPVSLRIPGRADPSPRSGIRERGGEELDTTFEEQKPTLDSLARGKRGPIPR